MVTWIELDDFRCPVKGCPSQATGIKWVCARDNNPTFLSEEGVIKCKTGAHSGLMCTWRWNCGNSFHKGEFLSGDAEGFIFACSQAVQLMTKGGSQWVAKLMIELGKQYGV